MLRSIILGLTLCSVLGCTPKNGPGPGVPSKLDCAIDAVKQNGPSLLPAVNSCLRDLNITQCLLDLVRPAAGITETVLACTVRHVATERMHAAQVNGEDHVSASMAENAQAFIAERGYTFSD